MRHFFLFITLSSFLFASCNLEQEIDIKLPDYNSHLVVECYLQPGQNYRLLLTRSSAYFDPFSTEQEFFNDLLVDGATVYIHYRDRTVRLFDQPQFDLGSRKVYNYTSDRRVPQNYEDEFQLEIITENSDTLWANTYILPPVPIDSIVTEFNDTDTLARVLTYFTDPPDTANYYRRMLHESTLDSLPLQDFAVDDRFVDGVFVFGTGYDFAEGDTLYNTIFHIDKAYYDFQETFVRAASSNGNPFGQPSPIASNIWGTTDVIGIFTGLSFVRKRTIIERK